MDDDDVSNYISSHALHIAHVVERTTIAKSGLEALELVKKTPFDLILLDVKMPVMDGFQFLEAVQRLQETTGILPPAIVLLTTSEHDLDKARAQQHPIKGYLVKPLTQQQVKHLVGLVTEGAA